MPATATRADTEHHWLKALRDPRTTDAAAEVLGRNLWTHGLRMVAHRRRVAPRIRTKER